MIPLEQALSEILDAVHPLGTECVPIEDALNRVPAAPLHASLDVPAFDNAAVDGYAIRTQDLPPSTSEHPARLRIHTTVTAGEPPLTFLPPGSCARIFTGAVLPPDANAVVMQEDTAAAPPDHVSLLSAVSPWEGVRFAGEDVRRGTLLTPQGQRLHAAHLGLLAAAGVASVVTHKHPRIALFTSGNELVDPGIALAPGQIPDSNRPLLLGLARTARAQVAVTGRIPDALEPAMEALRAATSAADVVITTGGVSVGDTDVLKAAFKALGGSIHVWRIAVRPGKPFVWGRLGKAHWFGLPGNPVSAFVTWQLLVLPALRRLEGETEVSGRRITARLGESLSNRGDRLHVVRAHVAPSGVVHPIGTQSSHIQSGLAAANALLAIPAGAAWEKGRDAEVLLLD